MAELVWDEVGQRTYETGVDRGVLYFSGLVAPWNGLVSVSESLSRESKSYYLDGIKYMERLVGGAYSAKLQAFTYPDLLDDALGLGSIAPGVRAHEQPIKMFHLSYRTKIGNDVDGTDHGYKLHVVYNILANPSDFAHNTLGGPPSIAPFEWTLSAVPGGIESGLWTSHFSVDSREASAILGPLESLLYGTDETDPQIPVDPNAFVAWLTGGV